MEEVNQKIIDAAIAIVQMLRQIGHSISIDGDPYVIQTTHGMKETTVELWCGGSKCDACAAMNVIQRYHNAIINM